MYSQLLNNYTLPDNTSDGSINNHDRYETAIVYGKTELIITNLLHFQEYSIEVVAVYIRGVGGLMIN